MNTRRKKVNIKDLNYVVLHMKHLRGKQVRIVYQFIEKHMVPLYKEAGVRWNQYSVLNRLRSQKSYLIEISNYEKELVGALVYQFSKEYNPRKDKNEKCIYIYDFCIAPEYQRNRLGISTLAILTNLNIKRGHGNKRFLLTVLRKNRIALEFYKYLEFRVHENTPYNQPYVILQSKRLKDFKKILNKKLNIKNNNDV